jgi:glycosyltransferase involved in cell wall biosynthesis
VNILWLKTELLHSLDDDRRTRTYHLLRELRREHQVTYLTFDDCQDGADAVARASEYCTTLVRVPIRIPARRSFASYRKLVRSVAAPLPYAVSTYRSSAMEQRIEGMVRDDSIDVVICDSLISAVNVAAGLPVPTILFQHKVEALAWYERTVRARNLVRKQYLLRQWYRMYAFERSQCRRVDHVIAVSPEDLAWFSVEYGARYVSAIPTGIDADVFQPSRSASAEPGQVLFVGAMDQAPNEDAASYLVTAILPRVRERASDVTLSIVGRDPTPNVRALARVDAGVHVTGAVADVRQYMERAAVVVVPLRIGGGTRREILEAMAMEKSIVSTTVGAETLPVRDGEHLLIADTPEQFATAIARLINDPAFGRELGRRAGELARSEFEWSEVATRFVETCGRVIGARCESSLASR